MKNIIYEIEFYSNWHCGSGLAAGADVDVLVVKDANGMPYVPGRTLKGLLREAAETLCDDKANIDNIFGTSGDQDDHKTGEAFFGNATLPESEYRYITEKKLTPHLFQAFSSTAIDEQGIAKDNTLRKIETVVPCKLEGNILNVSDDGVTLLKLAMSFVKRMGTGRNRGYGRCKITIKEEEEA